MGLRLHNTLTGKVEPFEPLKPSEVSLYLCGITVYDDCHVGHARGAVVFDAFRRFLESRKLRVTHIRNITDVDDKIIDRARKEDASSGDLNARTKRVAEKYTGRFQADFKKLGLLPPTQEPKATEFIPQMIALIGDLIKREMAYETADGVYFSVRKLSEYGRLSHQKPDQMLENHRAETGDGKKDSLDFALWKKAKPDEPQWPSPWGAGRPGWHIECTTMSTRLLGDQFDIHGGGQDLVFPHHENELAQALGAKKPFARTWMHNGLLTINGQKMSKSLGNFVTLEEVLSKYPADVVRLFFLSVHYHSPVDFTWERMEEAKHSYGRLTAFLAHAESKPAATAAPDLSGPEKDFYEALEDNFNTPRALACLHDLTRHPSPKEAAGLLRALAKTLGFFQADAGVDDAIQQLVDQRDQVRAKKDFAASDRIRKELNDLGYLVEDTAGKTVVRKKI